MANITIAELPYVTLPMTGNEDIPIMQAGVAKRMKPSDVAAFQGAYIKQDGTVAFSADQSLGGKNLKNLGAPVDDNDAVRKIDIAELYWDEEGW